MGKSTKFSNLSLSAYAFGYGCGFVNDNRAEAMGVQNISLDDLNQMSLKYNLGGVEIPVDKYFKDKGVQEFKAYLKKLEDIDLRLIYAFENFEHKFFSEIAPFIKFQNGNLIRVKISNFYGGNRFKEDIYKSDIARFRSEIIKSINVIDQYGIRVLIENHQDVTLHDIFELVEEFGKDRIGINWDTGNSFPTGETVESFLKKSIDLIGNVHLKDYRVKLSPDGYVMHRCALGNGIVDFEYLINKLYQFNSNMPFTIELGAMNGREAIINDELYWLHTKGVSEEDKNNLIDFVRSKAVNNEEVSSLWERKASPDLILNSELNEVVSSINYIQKILNKVNENYK